ncbi:MAG: hypothetical protein U9Q66_02245 [Patescibacteria group bacterium]|nr:hypothetical protein [Patescibacteria group bacterium]
MKFEKIDYKKLSKEEIEEYVNVLNTSFTEGDFVAKIEKNTTILNSEIVKSFKKNKVLNDNI